MTYNVLMGTINLSHSLILTRPDPTSETTGPHLTRSDPLVDATHVQLWTLFPGGAGLASTRMSRLWTVVNNCPVATIPLLAPYTQIPMMAYCAKFGCCQ